ncbi:histone-lysine N-methyltransferase SETMAR [Trichonephila clavipes]|nr:histone-lysine N-methyltransferase SETMAR [Trichonephila clavipes]
MSDSMVRRWVRQFNEGRSEVHDEERSGRPSLITEKLVHAIDEKIKENRKFTISALAMEFPQISRSLMHEIVNDKLKFHQLCARWVPKILTESHKTKRIGCALEFLTRCHESGLDFLSQIVTGDETWVSYETPESKRQSMEWRHTSSPTRVKPKHILTSRKIMCTVFWDSKGILLIDFLREVKQSMQLFTARHLGNCAAQYRIRAEDFCQKVWFFFTIMHDHTLQM